MIASFTEYAMRFQVIFTGVALTLGTSALAGGSNSWGTASDVLALGLPALAAGAAWAQNDSEGVTSLTYSLGSAYAATMVLKKSIHATRPDGSDNESFPSGHTAMAFAAARFMDKRYGADVAAYTPWLYVAAGLTGVARVQANQHRFQDVLAGGALGYATAHYFTEPVKGGQLSLLPTPGGAAVAWHRSF
jgi:membrane-associated phospholipid phosphatase